MSSRKHLTDRLLDISVNNPDVWFGIAAVITLAGFIFAFVPPPQEQIRVLSPFVAGAGFILLAIQLMCFQYTRLKEPFDRVATAATKAVISASSLESLSPEHAKFIAKELGGPVLVRTVNLQGEQPLTSQLEMTFRVINVESFKDDMGKIITVERIITWVPLFSNGTAGKLLDVIKPIIVHSVGTKYHGLSKVRGIVDHGMLETLWPIPEAWLKPGDINELRQMNFLKVDCIEVGNDVITDDSELGRYQSFMDFDKAAEDKIMNCLKGYIPSAKSDMKLEKELRSLLNISVGIWWPPKEKIRVNARSKISVTSKYKVWVRGGQEEVLYRYQVPFIQPAFVRAIDFSLDSAVTEKEKWVLDPPHIQCAFPLTSASERQLQQSNAMYDQKLKWQGEGSYGTPFLPGHGVAFMWRNISGGQTSSDS